jgi:hypothetical protein
MAGSAFADLLARHRDSIVWASSNNERMDRVLATWEEHLVHPHLPRTLTRLLRDAGLEVTDRQIVPLFQRRL